MSFKSEVLPMWGKHCYFSVICYEICVSLILVITPPSVFMLTILELNDD